MLTAVSKDRGKRCAELHRSTQQLASPFSFFLISVLHSFWSAVLELAGTSSKPRIAGPLAHVHNGSGGDDEEDEEEDEENEGSGVNMEQQGKQQQAAYDDEVAGADLGGNSSDDCNAGKPSKG